MLIVKDTKEFRRELEQRLDRTKDSLSSVERTMKGKTAQLLQKARLESALATINEALELLTAFEKYQPTLAGVVISNKEVMKIQELTANTRKELKAMLQTRFDIAAEDYRQNANSVNYQYLQDTMLALQHVQHNIRQVKDKE